MNAVWLLAFSLLFFILAYKFYGNFIAKKIFNVDKNNKLPSAELRDDVDYIPTQKEVLFGHHFASIAGTGPIVGPAIAVIWGWVPAVIWVLIGSVFAGAVHDFAALIISVRHKGASVGELSKTIINQRMQKIFLFVIFFALWIVVAIFGLVIAIIFKIYPQSILPVWLQVPIAMIIGFLAYKKNANITLLSVVAVVLMYLSIIAGIHFPFVMPSLFGFDPITIWIIILFIYAFIASVLPVWILLQPRDYINSHQLIIGMSLLVLGILFSKPQIVAPLIQVAPPGAPPILPFIFITIACGAVSGFHSLVSSGTTSKQLKNELEAKYIGYGGMLVEGFLAILVIIAVTAGIGLYVKTKNDLVLTGKQAWSHYYSSWAAMQGLDAKISAFVNGSANMLKTIGIPLKYGYGVIGVLIASFAGTTLDTATRIQRYILTEIGENYKLKIFSNRYISTFTVVLLAALLAFSHGAGKGALLLWPLFGASNQILAGIALLVATAYLSKIQRQKWPVIIPMIFMIIISIWAMIVNLQIFMQAKNLFLVIMGIILLSLEVWMIGEGFKVFRKFSGPASFQFDGRE